MPRQSLAVTAPIAKTKFASITSGPGSLSDVVIYGESTQASTPTPDVPVSIVSTTGNVTVKSAAINMLPENLAIVSTTADGITISRNSNGSYSVTGTKVGTNFTTFASSGFPANSRVFLKAGVTYTTAGTGGLTLSTLKASSLAFHANYSGVFTPSEDVYVSSYYWATNTPGVTNTTMWPMLMAGNGTFTAAVYKPHLSFTQTLALASLQLRSLPNGVSDRIYKSSGSWLRETNVGAKTLDGSESWVSGTAGATHTSYSLTDPTAKPQGSFLVSTLANILSDKVAGTSWYNAYTNSNTESLSIHDGVNQIKLSLLNSRLTATTSAGIKAWLATNPLNTIYQLDTPATTQITDPTLIAALESIRTYQGITNITSSTPITGVYDTGVLSVRPSAPLRHPVRDMKASYLATASPSSYIQQDTPYVFDPAKSFTYAGWYCQQGANSYLVLHKRALDSTAGIQLMIAGNAIIMQERKSYGQVAIYYVPAPNQWCHYVLVYDAVAKTFTAIVNGAVKGSITTSTINSNLTGLSNGFSRFLGSSAALETAVGAHHGIMFFNEKALTTKQAVELYQDGKTDIMPTLWYGGNEGTGSVIRDLSGNGNAGTMINGSYTLDVPAKIRKEVDANLVYNGDFEYAPPFVATTTTNFRWINGTAAGTTTKTVFEWHFSGSGTIACMFDSSTYFSGSKSMKISTLAASSYVELRGSADGYPTKRNEGFALVPNVSYTLTYRMKTNYVSGDSAGGAFLRINLANGDSTNIQEFTGTAVKTTTGWTQYTIIFTPNANVRRGHIELVLYGHNGLGTLIMDAWFDDIVLKPTVATTRNLS